MWRRKMEQGDRKLNIIRVMAGRSSKFTVGGRERTNGVPKPVTLPKVNLDKEPGTDR